MSRKRREGRADYTIFKPDGTKVFDGFEFFTMFGWSVGLHKFTGGDEIGCFHTHFGTAYRLILWGGYVEEFRFPLSDKTAWHTFLPGSFGRITHDYEHRIDHLLNGKSSWSLWIRGPRTHNITTRGC